MISIITTALALAKRGLGAMPSNKQCAESNTSALLATIVSGLFCMNSIQIFRVGKANLHVDIKEPPCVMPLRSMIRTQGGTLFPAV